MLTEGKGDRRYQILVLLVLFLALVGFALSVIALAQHVLLTNNLATGPSFCNISAAINCDVVNASEWSSIFGVPIASYGMFFYLVLVGGALATFVMPLFRPQRFLPLVLLLSVAANLGSVYLFGLSWFIIKALCLLCIGLYAVNLLILLVVWRGTFAGGFRSALGEALSCVISFSKVFLRGEVAGQRWAARLVVLGLLLLAYWNVVAPQQLLAYYVAARGPEQQETVEGAVAQWEKAPESLLSLRLNEGPSGDYWKGDLNAPIRIVEFADYGCGACRVMSGVLRELLQRYSGSYLYVFRDYPLDNGCNPSIPQPFHRFSCLATHIARCAGEQGRFWQASDFLFEADELESEGPVEQVKPALLSRITQRLGLDGDALNECVDSDRYRAAIQRDVKDGDALQLEGTPSFWVNERKVPLFSPEVLEAIFQRIINKNTQQQ